MKQSRYGRFENGNFYAPIAVFGMSRPQYMLFQIGNYQFVGLEQEEYLEQGRIKVFRGIRNREEYLHPTIDDDIREDYMKYVAISFLSYSLALAFNHNACRAETNHINNELNHDIYNELDMSLPSFRHLERPFSTDEQTSSGKFGPNYISMVTPIDNIRIFSQWCGENEVYIIDPARVEDVELHIKKDKERLIQKQNLIVSNHEVMRN